MAAKKKMPQDKGANTRSSTRSLRDGAEKELTRSRKISTDLTGQTPEQLNHELQVHQIELEMQAEELMKSKIALEESRDNYFDLYEFAPVGYLTLTDKGIITNANLTGAMLLGVDRSTLIRAPLSKCIAEKDADTWHRYFVSVRKEEENQTCTLLLKRGDGSVFPARLESIRISNSSDKTTTVRVAISDITDIKQAEEAQRESGQRFIYSLNAVEIGAWDLDLVSHTAWRSLHHDQIFGYEELLPEWTYETFLDHVLPEDRAIVDTKFGNALKNLSTWDFECRIRRKDGAIRWIWAKGQPEFNDLHEPKKMFGIVQDITRRKQSEDEMKRSFERFKMVMDGLDALVYVMDMETYELLFINKYGKDIWGEIEGQTCWKTIQSGQSGPCPFCTNDKLVDSNGNPTGVYRWEFQNTVKGRWYDCRDSAIRWIDGRFVRLEIATDITERKQVEEKLKLANRKLALMNDVAYQDIQNKVTALRGYAEISKDTKTEAERSAFIAKEEKILADIHQLIKNTKQYQEMGLDQLQWIPAEQEIRLAAALTSLDSTIPIDADLHGLELYTDPLIGKVFFHLVDNAMKHGAGLTQITISCHETPEGLVLVCEDDGAGIDPSKRATLFSRITGDNARFGLFFVKESLLLSGMTIVETSEPGKGARFEIMVPKGAYRMNLVTEGGHGSGS